MVNQPPELCFLKSEKEPNVEVDCNDIRLRYNAPFIQPTQQGEDLSDYYIRHPESDEVVGLDPSVNDPLANHNQNDRPEKPENRFNSQPPRQIDVPISRTKRGR